MVCGVTVAKESLSRQVIPDGVCQRRTRGNIFAVEMDDGQGARFLEIFADNHENRVSTVCNHSGLY